MKWAPWVVLLSLSIGCESLEPRESDVVPRDSLPLVDQVLDLAVDHYGGREWLRSLEGTTRSGAGRYLPDFLGRPGPHTVRFSLELSFDGHLKERIEYPDVPTVIEAELTEAGGRQTVNETLSQPVSKQDAEERLRKAQLSHPVTALRYFFERRARLDEPELLDLVLGRNAWRLQLEEDVERSAFLWLDPTDGRVLRVEYSVRTQSWGGGRFDIEFPQEALQDGVPGPPKVFTYRDGERIQEVTYEDVTWRR
ncbi:MAG: hypothetical protein RL885_26825 [Planctomycetota bacterium]